MTTRPATWLIAALLTSTLLASPAATAVEGASCDSPRGAIYTLLVYLQDDDRNNPGRAAACIDREGMESPAVEAPKVAIRLKKILDARGLYVVLEDIPNDKDYKDKDDKHRYSLFPDDLPGMTWERNADGRWLLTSISRDSVTTLYHQTFRVNLDDVVESMPSWLRARLLGIQLWQLLALLVLAFVAMAARRLVLYIFGRWVHKFTKQVKAKWVDSIITLSDDPIGALVVAAIVAIGFPALQFPVGVNKIAVLAARVLAAVSIVWLGYRLVDVLTDYMADRAEATESKLDDQVVPLIRKSLKLFLAIVGGIFVLQNLQVDVGSLLAGVGIGGLAFALAAKDTVANLFGSLMIFIDKPFQIGDWIIIGSNVEGSVEEVGFRTTRIRTFYNSLITLPNMLVTNSAVDNMGLRRYRRYKTSLGLTYDTPPAKVQAFCEGVRAIIASTEGMRKDFYMVEFHSFGQSELNIMIYCFMDVPDWNAELKARTNLNLAILRLAQDLGVSFAFPSQSLYVEQMPTDKPATTGVSDDPKALASLLAEYSEGGARSLPRGVTISPGYYPGHVIPKGSHTESDEDAGQS